MTCGERHALMVRRANRATTHDERTYWQDRAMLAYDTAELLGWDAPYPA